MSSPPKRSILAITLVFFLAACSASQNPTPTPWLDNPYAPQPGDGSLTQDDVQIVKTEVQTLESSPLQFELNISFFPPTPCHQNRVVVDQPDANHRINVQVYSLRKPNQVCTLMALNTPTVASLNLGSFASGHYTLWVNGEMAAEFDA